MLDLFDLANNVSSQVIILLVTLELASLVVTVVTQGTARGIATVCLILVLIMLALVLKDTERISTWLKDLIFKPNAGFILPTRG